MKDIKNIFGGLFGRHVKDKAPNQPRLQLVEKAKPALGAEQMPKVPYKKGDFIGKDYEVYGLLGRGGFGIVYLVYSHGTKSVYALKTFRDEYLQNARMRERFRGEAQVWVDLERHPYLVRAFFVDEVAGRLYIAMEFVAPDEEGLNSLEGYLQRRPPDLPQSLRWGIQFCYGMEYAYSRGIRAHRDIKPANILISQRQTVKIADFGLAGLLASARPATGAALCLPHDRVGFSCTLDGAGFGTPTHMPPEQFTNAGGCDERSDIYAFGIVLYQMAAGGKLPFLAPVPKDGSEGEMEQFWRNMYWLHSESPVPSLNSPLFPIIQRCLKKEPAQRYQTFKELRKGLEPLLQHETGEVVRPPELTELEAWEWGFKGMSFETLGLFDEAIRCYDRALQVEPKYACVWSGKGGSLSKLRRYEEAISCFDKALELDRRNAMAWNRKGNSLGMQGRHNEAVLCFGRAVELDPRLAGAWASKGNGLLALGRFEEAIRCCDTALELDGQQARAWRIKGLCLCDAGRKEEGIRCYDKAIELDPRDAEAWHMKGDALRGLGCPEEAIRCYDKALQLDPRDPSKWRNKGSRFLRFRRFVEAIRCYDKALELDPQDSLAWFSKALAEEKLSRSGDAARSYREFLALAGPEDTELVEHARQQLRELEGR